MFAASPPFARFSHFRLAIPLFSALMFAALIALWPTTAYAGDITVDGTTCTLPDAIAAANTDATVSGCSISGAAGVETLLLTASSYSLTFNATYNVDGSNATPSVTTAIIISSTLPGGSIVQRTGGSNSRLFHVASAGNLTLRGITVRYGKLGATANNSDYGAGIFNRGLVSLFDSDLISNTGHRGAGLYNTGTARFTNAEVYNNVATQHGGGIYNNNSSKTVTMTNTQVISNSATSNGGGLYNNTSSTITLINSDVISNSAVNGAGILNSTSSTIVTVDSDLRGNKASGSGGALQNNSGTTTITTAEISLNTATNDGAGLYNNVTGTLTISNAQIITNISGRNGGGIFNGKTATVVNSTFRGNEAADDGGGLYNTAGISTIRNSSFIGNKAQTGGAISTNIQGTKVLLSNSELIQNSATGDGGGIYINMNNSSAAITSTTILSNSAGGQGGGLIIQPNSSATMSGTLFIGNVSGGEGGGIHASTNATFVLTNGKFNQNAANSQGGGVYTLANATISNTNFISNTALGQGGGLYGGFTSDLNLGNSDFIGNKSNSDGGGLFAGQVTVVTDSDFLKNKSGGGGGAIYTSFPGILKVTNANIEDNSSNGSGGGIHTANNITLKQINFHRNTSTNGSGGGLYVPTGASNLSLTDIDFIENKAGASGGGIYAGYTGGITLNSSSIFSNTARNGQGGAIFSFNTVNMSSSPIRNNRAGSDGGAIYSQWGYVNLSSSDMISNTSGGSGGAIWTFEKASLTNSDLISSTAVGNGGGIYANQYVEISGADIISNTSLSGDGGVFYTIYGDYSNSISSSPTRFNRAAGSGGAFYAAGSLTLNNSNVISNYAGGDGGGIYAHHNLTLNTSSVYSNTAGGSGGGFYADRNSNLTSSDIAGNRAFGRGGGAYNSSLNNVTITGSDFYNNSAEGDGGGLYLSITTTTAIDNSDFLTNTTQGRGGGIFVNAGSTFDLISSEIRANTAISHGGGFYNNASFTFTDIHVDNNQTSHNGGGIYSNNGAITGTLSTITGNWANGSGGGLYQRLGQTNLSELQFLNNDAGDTGGATHFAAGGATINDSCIVNNQYISVNYFGNSTIDAANNWWGAVNGPSGVALGAGDSITNSVTFIPFETSPISTCPTLTADVELIKTVSPAGNLLPGQPVTFTLVVSNNSEITGVNHLQLKDIAPAELLLTEAADISLPYLDGGEAAALYLHGVITGTLNADTVLTNTATISGFLTPLITTSAQFNVKVPRLSWSQPSYSAGEQIGIFTATVTISPTNPYTIVTAQANAPSPSVSNITFTVGSSSQPVAVPVVNDSLVFTRAIPLTLFASWGAAIDGAGDEATIFTIEDDAAPALTVSKTANIAQAFVGETITYTYRITNSGNVTLTTITATDDRLGVVAGLTGQLNPLGTQTATLTYVVQPSDLPGPLVNTVTVTGTNVFTLPVSQSDSVSVLVILPAPALVVEKSANVAQAWVGDTITYTYRITNTGNVTLTTITATDDQLGAVAGLAGQLSPSGTRTATLTYVVQPSDLPGPLVNTVTVTGADIFATNVNDDDSMSIVLASPSVSFTKQANPAGELLPGQPLVYTLTITNEEDRALDDLYVTDLLPAGFVLSGTNTSGPSITFNGTSYVIDQLLAEQVATIEFVGAVDAATSTAFALQNTATVSNSLIGTLSDSTSNDVTVPTISWSENNYVVDEKNGVFTATLLLSPANPYASVSVNVIVTENSESFSSESVNNMSVLQAAEVIEITFPPGSTSQPVVVTFVEDGVVVRRNISLQLQSPSGATIGGGIDGSLSNIEIIEENAAPALALVATVNPTQVFVGDTVTYTYRITNTGNVTFTTIVATDERVGTIAGLSGQLNPGEARSADVAYTVESSDLPGPLVNTVTVTGTDIFTTNVSQSAATTVTINSPTALPETEQPQQPRLQIYLPSVEATKE